MTISDVKPYINNAKEHPKKQIDLLAKVIKEVGWRQNVEVNQRGVIVAGHGRWLVWEDHKNDPKMPPIWITDDKGNTIHGQHDERPLTEEQEQMWRLADNQLNAMTGFDMSLVIPELKGLSDEMLEMTGFDKDLVIGADERDDEVPEAPEEPRSKVGDLYELGSHRVLCGDSTKIEDVERLMDGKKADMVFTDPPYNVNYSGTGENTSNGIMNDKMLDGDFDEFLKQAFLRYSEISKKGAGWYIFHSSSTQDQFKKQIEGAGWKVKTQIIWNKPSASMGWGDYRMKHEPMFYCGNEETAFYGDRTGTSVWDFHKYKDDLVKWANKMLRYEAEGKTSVWTMARENVNGYVHPTQKPVELIMRALHNSSKAGDIVADFFGGSGSTLIACHKMNRGGYIMELDPRYTDVIVQRYVDYVDNPVVKLNGNIIQWQKSQKTEKKTETSD